MGNVKNEVRDILSQYLEQHNMRKTVERFAVLDAAYSFDTCFTIEELRNLLEKRNFPISRATLYNSLKLFMELKLVVCHRLQQSTKYEAALQVNSNCHQICTSCGKVSKIDSKEISSVVWNTRLKRFRMDGFSLYVYGMCSNCVARQTRERNRKCDKKDCDKLIKEKSNKQ